MILYHWWSRVAFLTLTGLAVPVFCEEMEIGELFRKVSLTRSEKVDLLNPAVRVYINSLTASDALALLKSHADQSSRALVAWVRSERGDISREEKLAHLGHLFNAKKVIDPLTAIMVFNQAVLMYPSDYIQISLLNDMKRADWLISDNEFTTLEMKSRPLQKALSQ